MNMPRVCVVLLALSAIALLAVHLRVEQTKSAARALRIESDWLTLRREQWELQARAARLRAPERLRDCLAAWQVGLVPPEADDTAFSTWRLASDRVPE